MINKLNFLEDLNIKPTPDIVERLNIWHDAFIQYNSHTNLMSRKDVDFLFEKHVFDSLAINMWDEFKNHKKILDIGTGGGFPSVIIAIFFPDKNILANDSRIKKINFIKEIKEKLSLENLEVIYSRIEEIEPLGADLIVSRAVGKTVDVYELSKKHLSKNAKFLIYKSKTIEDEIKDFKKKYKNAKFEIIPYKLPLKENYERNLVILSF